MAYKHNRISMKYCILLLEIVFFYYHIVLSKERRCLIGNNPAYNLKVIENSNAYTYLHLLFIGARWIIVNGVNI